MSDIQLGLQRMSDGATVKSTVSLPLIGLYTGYGNQVQIFTLPGTWTATVEDSSSDITVTYGPSSNAPGATDVTFCFKSAVPGAVTDGTLTDMTVPASPQSYNIVLSVPAQG
jgi:hypothetical protein